MRKLTQTLLLVVFSVIIGTSCMRVKQVEVNDVEKVQMLSMTDSTAEMAVSIRVHNPNNMKIHIKACDLDASINHHAVGKVNIVDKIILPKKSKDVYTVILKADMREIHKLAPAMMFSSKALVGLKGSLKVKAKGINKTVDINVEEKIAKKELMNMMAKNE